MSKLMQAVQSVSLPRLSSAAAASSAAPVRAEVIRVDVLAGELGVCTRTLRRRSQAGTFPPFVYPLGRRIPMVRRDHYDAWLRGEHPWRKS